MKPFTVILGIILGTCLAIAFGLAVVFLIFWILSSEHPRLAVEMPNLARSSGIFLVLTALAASSFFGSLRAAPWRHTPLVLLWVGLAITGWYYWP